MRRQAGAAALTLALVALAGPARPVDYSTNGQSFPEIARGRYLAIVSDCAACHDGPDGTPFAGGKPIETPFGTMHAPNITPDRATGIGAWSDDEFYRALHKGKGDVKLYPVMPYTAYTKLTRPDVMAIRAYLNTVQPVSNDVQSNTLPFPFDLRGPATTVWDWLNFSPGEYKNDPQKSAEWNRGAYLVEGAGHCGTCHTPKNWLGADQGGKFLQGNALQGWFAPDITNDKRVGLGSWTAEDITEYLKTGHNRFADASGPMAEEIRDSSSQWTLTDLKAAAVYLKALPGANAQAPSPLAASDARMQAGQAIYVDQCAACHSMDGRGIERMFPTLNGTPFVQSPEPSSLLQVVVNGTRTVATDEAPTAQAMPAFGWKLSNAEIAAVVTYVRNSWGNAARPVSADEVQPLRNAGSASGG